VLLGDPSTGDAQASAIAEFRSTTRGVRMPVMTQAQRDAIVTPVSGLDIFNGTTNRPNYYNGAAWIEYGQSYSTIPPSVVTYTAGDTAPSIAGAGPVVTMNIANSVATTITSFPGASGNGQLLLLIFQDANTTVTRATAHLDGGVNYVSTRFGTLALVYYAGIWYQVGKTPANN